MRKYQIFIFILLLFGCKNDINSESIILHNARTAFLIGENITSESLYKKYLQLYPKGDYRKEAWERIYDITLNLRNNNAEAIQLLESMLLEFSHDKQYVSEIIGLLAKNYSELHLTEKVVDLWIQYLNISEISESKKNIARITLSKQYLALNNYELALKILKECQSISDKFNINLSCQLQEAQIYFIIKQLDKSSEAIENLIKKINPTCDLYFQSKLLLAEIHELKNEKKTAKTIYNEMLQFYPNHQIINNRLDNLH